MNYDETITTLQFASRAIKIKVHAHINEKIEMKKIKDKLNDLNKITKLDLMINENKKLQRDADDIKSDFKNLRNELKKAKSKSDLRLENEEHNGDRDFNSSKNFQDLRSQSYSRSKSELQHPAHRSYNSYSSNNNLLNAHSAHLESQVSEFSIISKKFHFMILHLQTELAKNVIMNHNLMEENKILKEKLMKYEKSEN
jgi:hypothetical protein